MGLRVTLHDIATACGVGKSTVARALSGNPHVSPAMRERIRAKAEELGYRPAPGLRILSLHRWKGGSSALTLGVVCQRTSHSRGFRLHRAALRERAALLGYSVEEFWLHDYPGTRRLGDVLYHRGIRGLLFPPLLEPVAWEWDWSRFAAVGCGIGEFRLPIHNVDINYFACTRLCWAECRRRGYRRIGPALFRQPGTDTNDSLRHAAIRYEQALVPASERVPILDSAMDDAESFKRWFNKHRPDAVIALNETPYWWMRELGFEAPRQAGFCVLVLGPRSEIRASGTASPLDRIGQGAVNLLDQLIRTNETGLPAVPDELLIEPVWEEGTTLRPAPAT